MLPAVFQIPPPLVEYKATGTPPFPTIRVKFENEPKGDDAMP
jgi:hypothetical protein